MTALTGLSGRSRLNSRMEQLIREGLVRPPTAKLPADFLRVRCPRIPEDWC